MVALGGWWPCIGCSWLGGIEVAQIGSQVMHAPASARRGVQAKKNQPRTVGFYMVVGWGLLNEALKPLLSIISPAYNFNLFPVLFPGFAFDTRILTINLQRFRSGFGWCCFASFSCARWSSMAGIDPLQRCRGQDMKRHPFRQGTAGIQT